MQSRAYWVMNLLNLSYPLEQIMPQLRLYPWDSQEALGVFEINHLVQILERYVHGELLANEVAMICSVLAMQVRTIRYT